MEGCFTDYFKSDLTRWVQDESSCATSYYNSYIFYHNYEDDEMLEGTILPPDTKFNEAYVMCQHGDFYGCLNNICREEYGHNYYAHINEISYTLWNFSYIVDADGVHGVPQLFPAMNINIFRTATPGYNIPIANCLKQCNSYTYGGLPPETYDGGVSNEPFNMEDTLRTYNNNGLSPEQVISVQTTYPPGMMTHQVTLQSEDDTVARYQSMGNAPCEDLYGQIQGSIVQLQPTPLTCDDPLQCSGVPYCFYCNAGHACQSVANGQSCDDTTYGPIANYSIAS